MKALTFTAALTLVASAAHASIDNRERAVSLIYFSDSSSHRI